MSARSYVPAYHRSGGSNLVPTRVVIHCTVSPCVIGGAMNTARYFQSPSSGGSAHKVADPGQVVICANDDVICWHAPPNQRSLGIELCDPQKGPSSRWQDVMHQAMLRLAAVEVHNWCITYGIHEVELRPTQLLAGQRGICGHVDVSNAWHMTDHTDPGIDFPWLQFLNLVTQGDDVGLTTDQDAKLSQTWLLAQAAARDSRNAANWSIDDSIDRMYRDLLGRPSDKAGLATWGAQAQKGATWQQVHDAIANSPEAKRRAAA